MNDWIISKAHEWVGDKDVLCVRCGLRVGIGEMKGAPRCVPHYESKESGYKPE